MSAVLARESGFLESDLDAPGRRLGAAALIFAAIAVPLGTLEHLTALAHPGLSLTFSFALLSAMASLSLALYFLCLRGSLSAERISYLGVAYEVSIAFLLALSFHGSSAAK